MDRKLALGRLGSNRATGIRKKSYWKKLDEKIYFTNATGRIGCTYEGRASQDQGSKIVFCKPALPVGKIID